MGNAEYMGILLLGYITILIEVFQNGSLKLDISDKRLTTTTLLGRG